jgi:hypothetical protein
MYVYALCASVNGSLVGHTKESSSTQEAILQSWNSWHHEVFNFCAVYLVLEIRLGIKVLSNEN